MVKNSTTKKMLKIWIKASFDVRTERIMKREKEIYYNLEKEKTNKREISEKNRYKKYYNIDIDDLSIYDIIIDADKLNQYQILEILTLTIKTYFNKK